MKGQTNISTKPKTLDETKLSQRRKIVLDTSVLLYEALAFKSFKNSDIYIPFSVLEEIDTFKRDLGEKGRNTRRFNRFIDSLRSKGSLTQGLELESGTRLFISKDLKPQELKAMGLDLSKTDHVVLATSLSLKEKHPTSQVELVSKDINLRIKADVFGITAKDYDTGTAPDFEELYTGYKKVLVSEKDLDVFREQKSLKVSALKKVSPFYPNQYVILQNGKDKDFGRYQADKEKIVSLFEPSDPIWGVFPRNKEQRFALDALMNDDIMVVSLLGKAGTGKTLLALAVGLQKVLEEGSFQKLMVSRPVFPMGRDIGYLPGDIEEKLNPWMRPIFDTVEFLMGLGKKASQRAEDLMSRGLIHIEPLAYIRGRSIPHQYLIVDEAQNLTPHEIKTTLTRAGQGTKVILTGDCYQIDNPYVDSANNGLVFSVEKLKQAKLSAHIMLQKGERSELAELAANLL